MTNLYRIECIEHDELFEVIYNYCNSVNGQIDDTQIIKEIKSADIVGFNLSRLNSDKLFLLDIKGLIKQFKPFLSRDFNKVRVLAKVNMTIHIYLSHAKKE